MWFWPVNEMTELVSGMPAPQFGDESSSVRGSELAQGSSGSVRSFPRSKDTGLENVGASTSQIPMGIHGLLRG
jgi:hypothetical protein